MPFIPRSSSRRPGPQPSLPAWPPAWKVDGPASLRRRGRVPDLVATLHLGPEAGDYPLDPRLVGRNRVERFKGGRGRIDSRIAADIPLQKFLCRLVAVGEGPVVKRIRHDLPLHPKIAEVVRIVGE